MESAEFVMPPLETLKTQHVSSSLYLEERATTARGGTEAWWSRTHEGITLTKTPNAHGGPTVMNGRLCPGDRAR